MKKDKEKDVLEPEEEENYNDMYDVVKATLKVHSPHDTLNSDFIIADLQPNIFENTAVIYIKEHLNIMVAINNYLVIEGDAEYKLLTQKLLLDEVISITNLSRADKGKVLLAILDYIKGQGNVGQTPNVEEVQKKNIVSKMIDKMTGKGKEE